MKTWFFPYMKKHWRGFVLAAGLSVLALLCAAGLMFTSGYLISKAALRPENILMLYVPIVAVRTFGIGRAALEYASRLSSHNTILRILSEMRTRLYRAVEPAALFIRSRYRTGDILGILADDIEHLQDIYLRTILPSIVVLTIYAVWIIFLGCFDWPFALLMGLYLMILVVFFPLFSLLWTKRKNSLVSKGRHRLYQKLTDAILGSADWMMSGRQMDFLNDYEKQEKELTRIDRKLHRLRRWRDVAGQFIIGISVISLVYWSGDMTARHVFDPTLIAAFVLVIFTIAEALLPVSEAVERIPQYRDSFRRLEDIEHSVHTENKAEQAIVLNEPIDHLDIRADHVYFKYEQNERWALQDVSLNIPQGKKVALIGRSGAGKSTLIHLIYGALRPGKGKIELNGHAPNEFGYNISNYIAVLNQSPHLFDTSIANNIRLGNERAAEQEIIHAAKQVKLDQYIESLPNGYRTRMQEAGQIFSGGERQRIALARILLRKAPVVILDEPTVGLDPLTEKNLLAMIFETLKERTLIWITHHLVGAEKMDEVIFLEDGKVEMQGSHDFLLKHNMRYRHLYQLDVPLELKKMLLKSNLQG